MQSPASRARSRCARFLSAAVIGALFFTVASIVAHATVTVKHFATSFAVRTRRESPYRQRCLPAVRTISPLSEAMPQIDEEEDRWRGFLLDKDCESARDLIPGEITSKNDDDDTIEEAWDSLKTIVTSNSDHFIEKIDRFQKRESGRECRDLWGLLTIPSEALVRERVLPEVKKGVVLGGALLRWPAIGYLNLVVSVHASGKVTVRRFARCSFCERERKAEWDWYTRLPTVGTKGR